MEHATKLERGTFYELAEELGNLRYDALAEFLEKLAAKIKNDSLKDAGRGRPQLADKLLEVSSLLSQSSRDMDWIWQLCLKYVPKH
jgi:hypothetical protein